MKREEGRKGKGHMKVSPESNNKASMLRQNALPFLPLPLPFCLLLCTLSGDPFFFLLLDLSLSFSALVLLSFRICISKEEEEEEEEKQDWMEALLDWREKERLSAKMASEGESA